MLEKGIQFFIQKEKYLFFIILFVNLCFLFNSKFYPTLDGPAHLHNSYVLQQLVSGGAFFKQYYFINTIPIPNWTNHIVLSSLLSILPPNFAEKGSFVFYILLLSISFRYFIKQIQPKNMAGTILVFPFLYSFLLYMGFMNFCFSIGFMFLSLGYYLKNQNQINFTKGFILSILIFLTYLSNVLGFVYLLLFLFSFSLVIHFRDVKKITKSIMIEFVRKSFKLLLICLIPLICLLVFYYSVVFFPSSHEYIVPELLDWIFDIRPIIVFDYIQDKKYTQVLYLLLIMTFAISAFNFFRIHPRFSLSFNTVLLMGLLITFISLIYVPDGSSAGMMSDRLALMFYFVFLAVLLSFPIPKKVLTFVVFSSIFLQFALFYFNHKNVINKHSENADKIYMASNKIQEKSVVLPINLSDDWMEGHFSNYLAINKEILILENYEASVGWFPLKWKVNDLPKFMLGTKQNFDNFYWTSNTESGKEEKIDYVFVYGNTSKLDQSEFTELKAELLNHYIKDESITDSYTQLYKLK